MSCGLLAWQEERKEKKKLRSAASEEEKKKRKAIYLENISLYYSKKEMEAYLDDADAYMEILWNQWRRTVVLDEILNAVKVKMI